MNQNRGRIAAALSALALACGITIAAAPATQAAPLPALTFRMQTATSGDCLGLDSLDALELGPCVLLDLDQQWTWNPLTEQLGNVGAQQCLKFGEEAVLIGTEVKTDYSGAEMVPCDASDTGQRWQRYPDSTSSSRWYLSPSGEPGFSLLNPAIGTAVGVEDILALGGTNQTPFQWTFTLV